MRTKFDCGCGGSSPVCSHADLPLDSANQLSQQMKISTYIIKKDIPFAHSQLVSEASSRELTPSWITVVVSLISRAFSFLLTVKTVYTLAHICALHAIAVTRAHGCPTALFYRSRTPALAAAVELEARSSS